MDRTASALVDELRSEGRPAEHPQKHYHGSAAVLGVRMGTLFGIAKRYTALPLSEVDRLLDVAEYEPRLAAFCVLDFKARKAKLPADERRGCYELYLGRHDRIDTWDMVDRAAPRVVGSYLLDKPRTPLFELARSADPLRRRTAMTAPLAFTGSGDPDALADLFALAELLVDDTDPVVSKPVGIALKYAGAADELALRAFLDRHAARMPRPALRYAVEKLDPSDRQSYLTRG
ncbi:DNA alkylation repair protein [Kribbella sp. NPDC050820]|uniref:DNA alkylation repair protein n=1 Tax=Kribbella sp. NPDC050820 TaxID=3155408 RepID=UPI0033E994F8